MEGFRLKWWCVEVVVVVVVMVVVMVPGVQVKADSHVEGRRLVEMSKEMTDIKQVEMKKKEVEEVEKRRQVENVVEEQVEEEEMRKIRTRLKETNGEQVEEMNKKKRLVEMSVEKEEEEEEEEVKAKEETSKKEEETETRKQMEVKRRLVEMTMKEEEKEKIKQEVEMKRRSVEEINQVEMRRRPLEMTVMKEVEENIKRPEEERRRMEMRGRLVEMTVEEEDDLPVLSLNPEEASLEAGESYTFKLSLSKDPEQCINVSFTLTEPLGTVAPSQVTLCTLTYPSAPPTTTLTTTVHGTTTIIANATPDDLVKYPSSSGAFSVVSVMKSKGITTAADVLGWVYTIAWDISFLPQIVHNWRRKSVIGLSFDFLTFNFIGFFSYFLFNMGMFWIPAIQDQYDLRNPQSILHVRLNDVIFPLYALVCTAAQIMQCFVFTREEGQRVSIACRIVSSLLLLAAVVGCILVPLVDDWWWIDVLYLLSYVKLAITCIKYIPQLYVNYKYRSTAGWSIYQVSLDFTGGVLSLVQMFLLSANYDDWESLLTDPAKLGLGLLSILFNILFFIQHFCLYRHGPSLEKTLKGEEGPMATLEGSPSPSTSPDIAETGLSDGKKGEEEKEEEGKKGERGDKEGEELKEVITEEEKEEEGKNEERGDKKGEELKEVITEEEEEKKREEEKEEKL